MCCHEAGGTVNPEEEENEKKKKEKEEKQKMNGIYQCFRFWSEGYICIRDDEEQLEWHIVHFARKHVVFGLEHTDMEIATILYCTYIYI